VINQKVTTRILEKWGHRVTVAENGKAAIAELEKQQFDLILMDIQMPEMDGLDATRQIRDLSRRGALPHTPIVALTAHALKADEHQCFEAGMDDYITKPIDVDFLLKTLENICYDRYHVYKQLQVGVH
jgi:two-component system, sensor histidine kinase and response regulator